MTYNQGGKYVMITPQRIARHLGKALKRDSLYLVHKTLAPCRFSVHLPSEFIDHMQPLLVRLQEELAEHVLKTARRLRGLELSGQVEVHLLEDPDLSPKQIRTETSFKGKKLLTGSLLTISGMDRRLEHNLIKPVTVIGRGEVDLCLPAERSFISRRHARIIIAHSAFLLEDLNSRCGTFVNERFVRECSLSQGDHITIGDITFLFK
jgi:hypothetical protein